MKKIIVEGGDSDWFPPFLAEYTEMEERMIESLWKLCGYGYIVDPLGHSQCLALMYDDLPWFFRCLFRVKKVRISKEQYDEEDW